MNSINKENSENLIKNESKNNSKNFNELKSLPNKPFVIFDMDGTLIDSMKFWDNLTEEYLVSKGINEDIEDLIREFQTMTVRESAEVVAKRFSLNIDPDTVVYEMDKLMEYHYLTDIPLKARTLKLLEDFKNSGVKMCVASATDKHLIVDCLKRLGILSYFEFVLSCDEFKTNKQVPTIYLEATKLFKTEPENVLVFEDALYAVKTAKTAGFTVIAVYDDGQESNWNEIREIADMAIDLN